MKSIKYIIFLVVLFISLKLTSYSQSVTGEIKEIQLLENKDTLVINRWVGDFWYGLAGGANLNYYLGNLSLPQDPNPEIPTEFVRLIDYKNGNGAGYYIGLIAEWLPPGEYFGLFGSARFWDFRSMTTTTDQLENARFENYRLINQADFSYLSLSASIRFSMPIPGLHFFTGVDYDMVTTTNSFHWTEFNNTANIDQKRQISYDRYDVNVNNRLAVHAGLGLDYLVLDLYDAYRVSLSPHIIASAGLNAFSGVNDNTSAMNLITARVGVAIKFGADNVSYDTLKYDPNAISPILSMGRANLESGISFDGFKKQEQFTSSKVTYIDVSNISEQVKEEPTLGLGASMGTRTQDEKVSTTKEVPKRTAEYFAKPGNGVFSYATFETTDYDSKMKEYFDEIIQFLKANPNYEIRIETHSEAFGTPEQRKQITIARATKARRYFMSKGIPEKRILTNHREAFNQIADNTTEAGRKKNRRIEIKVVTK